MRIFIDVGAHYGETLKVALDPKWGFDRVFSLEPATTCQRVLARYHDRRLVIEQTALSNRNGPSILYGAGLLGGSIYVNKRQHTEKPDEEPIELVRASDWFKANIPAESTVFLKLNCEGSEVDILEDLLEAGMHSQLRSIYIDFDIRKVAGQELRQPQTEARLKAAGVRYLSSDELGVRGNAAIGAWLERDCPKVRVPAARRIAHHLQTYAPLYDRLTTVLGHILPRRVYWWIGHRFGRVARQRAQR